jgi:uncharacterized protein (UPF0261 family)
VDQKRTVGIVVTLDTKAAAAGYLRDEIASWGLNTILIDPGILGQPGIPADISRAQVAQAAGTTLEALIASGRKDFAIAKQTEGLIAIVCRLHAEGKLDGIVGLGGGQGTSIAAAAMRALPVGVPKLILSTVATGTFQFGSYIGIKDLAMMHSVTDILDVNAISRAILRNAANAIAGMALRGPGAYQEDKPAIAITQLGQTTQCVMRVKSLLEPLGYQLVPFHASGAGGPAMEDLIEAGKFSGVIDLSVHEIIDGLMGGIAGAHHRLETLTRVKIPAVVSVGGGDYVLFESVRKAPQKYHDRIQMVHNPQMTCFLPTVEEMLEAAGYMIDHLNRALGPTVVIIPSLGFTESNKPGNAMWFPEGNLAVVHAFKAGLRPEVPLIVKDVHINHPAFADLAADCMARLLQGEPPLSIAARHTTTGVLDAADIHTSV